MLKSNKARERIVENIGIKTEADKQCWLSEWEVSAWNDKVYHEEK